MHPLNWIGRKLARLSCPSRATTRTSPRAGLTCSPRRLRKGDVLLIEGTSRFASAIRYVTQSTWSHAALYVGDALGANDGENRLFIEADINEGVRVMPLSHYEHWHTRICRPVGLNDAEIDALIAYAAARIGNQYDVRNVIDLARYLIRSPPVPDRYKRRLLALGSGEPTRAICSSLIASAFASVRYPVLPDIEIARPRVRPARSKCARSCTSAIRRLYAPRDFDVSPYFRIVKPSLQQGFDPHALDWARRSIRAERIAQADLVRAANPHADAGRDKYSTQSSKHSSGVVTRIASLRRRFR